MILTCPQCGTQYVVKDGAIPEQGRQVRCAACKHSWHQGPDEEGAADAGMTAVEETDWRPEAAAEPMMDEDVPAEADVASANEAEPESRFEGEPAAIAEPVAEPVAEPADVSLDTGEVTDNAAHTPEPHAWRAARPMEDEFSPFADRSVTIEGKRRRLLPLFLVLLLVAALAAAFWFLAPQEWRSRLGFGAAGTTPLQLMLTHSDRQRLESGNELLAVTGRVINPTEESHTVPPIQAQLRTRSGELVYRWTIAPPARTLPPGASATFNSAEVNVPAGGDELTISLGDPPA